jgi:hypothetical protein
MTTTTEMTTQIQKPMRSGVGDLPAPCWVRGFELGKAAMFGNLETTLE